VGGTTTSATRQRRVQCIWTSRQFARSFRRNQSFPIGVCLPTRPLEENDRRRWFDRHLRHDDCEHIYLPWSFRVMSLQLLALVLLATALRFTSIISDKEIGGCHSSGFSAMGLTRPQHRHIVVVVLTSLLYHTALTETAIFQPLIFIFSLLLMKRLMSYFNYTTNTPHSFC
jgi:hypothetical protein